ncbi:hypothetical protein PR048_014970 [Dryococelus australis]|uniref:Uncharacterized protein n=1 Tax=Dryococelus australis TaxID=614101 RepID=A0ABQ9HFT0_9NEOP|nr:hypothetical protein PR048_014970 [Dryococelus australis]
MRMIVVNMEQRWNEGRGKREIPEKNPDQRHRPARFRLAKRPLVVLEALGAILLAAAGGPARVLRDERPPPMVQVLCLTRPPSRALLQDFGAQRRPSLPVDLLLDYTHHPLIPPPACYSKPTVNLSPLAKFYGALENQIVRWLDYSPPTTVNEVRFPAGSLPDFQMWESCRKMPLVDGFSRGSPASPALAFRRCSPEHAAGYSVTKRVKCDGARTRNRFLGTRRVRCGWNKNMLGVPGMPRGAPKLSPFLPTLSLRRLRQNNILFSPWRGMRGVWSETAKWIVSGIVRACAYFVGWVMHMEEETVLSGLPHWIIQGVERMEKHRDGKAGDTRDPRESPLISGIVWHDSRMRNSGNDLAYD